MIKNWNLVIATWFLWSSNNMLCLWWASKPKVRFDDIFYDPKKVSNFVQVIQFVKHVICILWLLCYNATYTIKVPMILKTLFDLLEGVMSWKLLKGGVEKVKGESLK